MRNQLLDYLYRELDRDPDATSAMTLTHPDGVTWSVANRRLVVGTETGRRLVEIDLTAGTVWQVAFALMDAGIGVSRINPDFQRISAIALLDGAGTESSYTTALQVHRSVLWALMDGYATEVQAATDAVPQALRQARLHSAEAAWLDFWGSYFAVARRPAQPDAAYLASIVVETLRQKSNKYAIENAVFDITGSRVEITEPWQSIFRLDASQLSGAHALHDGVVVGYHLIRPVIPADSDWAGVMAVIDKTRAAGVVVSNPMRIVPAAQVVVMPIEPTVWASRFIDHTFLVGNINPDVLGRLVLDGYRPPINHPAAIFSLSSLGNPDGANSEQHIAPFRSVAKSSITLSDGFALGDINAVLGRGRIDRELVPAPSISDALALSDAQVVVTVARVTDIVLDARGALANVSAQINQSESGLTVAFGFVATLNTDMGWTGTWSVGRHWNDHCIFGMQTTHVFFTSVTSVLLPSGTQTFPSVLYVTDTTAVSTGPITISDGGIIEVLPEKTWRIV